MGHAPQPCIAPVPCSQLLISCDPLRSPPPPPQVLSVIHRAATVQDDEHSQQVCGCAMSALVPAWLGDGRDARDLWAVVVDALPEVLAHRRLPLLAALMAAMPPSHGLPVALLLLLQKAADAAAASAAASADKQAAGKDDASLDDWLPDLASKLAAQVGFGQFWAQHTSMPMTMPACTPWHALPMVGRRHD